MHLCGMSMGIVTLLKVTAFAPLDQISASYVLDLKFYLVQMVYTVFSHA